MSYEWWSVLSGVRVKACDEIARLLTVVSVGWRVASRREAAWKGKWSDYRSAR